VIYRADKEPAGRAAATRPRQAGVDGTASRHRGRRRPGDLWADGDL